MKFVHNNEIRPKKKLNCGACDWKGADIRLHWNETHINEPYPFACDKCDYRGNFNIKSHQVTKIIPHGVRHFQKILTFKTY